MDAQLVESPVAAETRHEHLVARGQAPGKVFDIVDSIRFPVHAERPVYQGVVDDLQLRHLFVCVVVLLLLPYSSILNLTILIVQTLEERCERVA